MKHTRSILVSILIGLMLFYEYDSGGFNRLYIKGLLINHDRVVTVYGANWCAPCKKIKPVLRCLHQSGLIKVVYVDVDNNPGAAARYGAVTPYIPMISINRNLDDGSSGLFYHGSSGLFYHGFFPSSKQEFMFQFFDGARVDYKVVDFCLKNLYKEEIL